MKGKDITFDEPDIANTSGAAAEPPGAAQGGNDGDVFTAGNGVSMLRVKNGRLGNGRQRGMNIGASDVIVENMKLHDLSKQTASPGPHPMIYCDANARRIDIVRNRFSASLVRLIAFRPKTQLSARLMAITTTAWLVVFRLMEDHRSSSTTTGVFRLGLRSQPARYYHGDRTQGSMP